MGIPAGTILSRAKREGWSRFKTRRCSSSATTRQPLSLHFKPLARQSS